MRFLGFAVSLIALLAMGGCGQPAAPSADAGHAYFDQTGRTDTLSGGVRMIPITTSAGTFRVWTKRVGNNPRIKVLVLHGGPGITHEAYEAFDSYLPEAGIEYYYYDQLGSAYSDQPHEPSLWNLDRFVDEVEQVRVALGLDRDNFFLYGQSWGGLLAIEYALKHQDNLKGLIVSNMMSDIPAYNEYAKNVLFPQMDPKILKEIQDLDARGEFTSPRYEALVMEHFYTEHIMRAPVAQWPEPLIRAFNHLNKEVYIPMQGPSELGARGALVNWSRKGDLHTIKVPTLVIGARYDTMDPSHMEWMSQQFPKGHYLYCDKGSHMAIYDDQATYMNGIIRFLLTTDKTETR